MPGCLLDYTIVEIIQAGMQCLLAVSIPDFKQNYSLVKKLTQKRSFESH